jgi:hypothetical protein
MRVGTSVHIVAEPKSLRTPLGTAVAESHQAVCTIIRFAVKPVTTTTLVENVMPKFI